MKTIKLTNSDGHTLYLDINSIIVIEESIRYTIIHTIIKSFEVKESAEEIQYWLESSVVNAPRNVSTEQQTTYEKFLSFLE